MYRLNWYFKITAPANGNLMFLILGLVPIVAHDKLTFKYKDLFMNNN